jgi:hypothetical protein
MKEEPSRVEATDGGCADRRANEIQVSDYDAVFIPGPQTTDLPKKPRDRCFPASQIFANVPLPQNAEEEALSQQR